MVEGECTGKVEALFTPHRLIVICERARKRLNYSIVIRLYGRSKAKDRFKDEMAGAPLYNSGTDLPIPKPTSIDDDIRTAIPISVKYLRSRLLIDGNRPRT